MAHFSKSTARDAPWAAELLLPIAPAASAGVVCAAGAVVGVGGPCGKIIVGGAGNPADNEAPELRRFAVGGSPGGELGPLAASSASHSAPMFRSNACDGATVGGVGVAAITASCFVGTAI